MSPRLRNQIRKSEQVATAVTEAEVALFERAATDAGMTVAEWLREAAFAGKYAEPPTPDGVRRHAIMVRMTAEQRVGLEAAAAKVGVKASSFIRACALAEMKRKK